MNHSTQVTKSHPPRNRLPLRGAPKNRTYIKHILNQGHLVVPSILSFSPRDLGWCGKPMAEVANPGVTPSFRDMVFINPPKWWAIEELGYSFNLRNYNLKTMFFSTQNWVVHSTQIFLVRHGQNMVFFGCHGSSIIGNPCGVISISELMTQKPCTKLQAMLWPWVIKCPHWTSPNH